MWVLLGAVQGVVCQLCVTRDALQGAPFASICFHALQAPPFASVLFRPSRHTQVPVQCNALVLHNLHGRHPPRALCAGTGPIWCCQVFFCGGCRYRVTALPEWTVGAVKRALWAGGIERSNKPPEKRGTPGLQRWEDLVGGGSPCSGGWDQGSG